MKGTKKCVLVPFEKYQRLVKKAQDPINPKSTETETTENLNDSAIIPETSPSISTEQSGEGSAAHVSEPVTGNTIPPPPGIPAQRKRQQKLTTADVKKKKIKTSEWKTLWQNLK
jgi:hypothetical protein